MHTSSHNQENIDPNHQSDNEIAGINVQNEMMKTLQLMQRQIQDLKTEISSNNNNNANNGKNQTWKGKKRHRPIVSKYCWTHGAWNHLSNNYKFKAEGHKDEATFQNWMGGSNEYCHPVNEWNVGTKKLVLYNSSVKNNKIRHINFSEVPPKNSIIAKGDSAASKNYWREEDIRYLTNFQPYAGPSVTLPNANIIAPSHKGSIQLSKELSEEAR